MTDPVRPRLSPGHRAGRTRLMTLVVLAAVSGVSGCAVPSSPSASPSTSLSPQPTRSGSTEPSAAPSAAPSASPPVQSRPAVAVTAGCLDLVPLQTMYDYDPNFGIVDGYTPPAGSLAATALAELGIVCRWVQQTSGADIVVAASTPSSSAYEAARTAAGVGAGDEAFSVDGGVGTLQVFDGTAWIVASSSYFGTADDARPLVDSAASALR